MPPRTQGTSSEGLTPPKSLDSTAAKIGSVIPDWAVSPLQAGKKYLVDPFEKMAAQGVQAGRELASDVSGDVEMLSHPARFMGPIPGLTSGPIMGPVPPNEDPNKVAEKEHPIATGDGARCRGHRRWNDCRPEELALHGEECCTAVASQGNSSRLWNRSGEVHT